MSEEQTTQTASQRAATIVEQKREKAAELEIERKDLLRDAKQIENAISEGLYDIIA